MKQPKSKAEEIVARLEEINKRLNPEPSKKSSKPKAPFFANLHTIEHYKRRMLGLPIWRKSRKLPCGYKVDPDNIYWLLPDQYQFEVLIQAKKYIMEGHPYATVGKWIRNDCGLQCPDTTLKSLMGYYRPLDIILTTTEEERERLYQTSAFDYYHWGTERARTWKEWEEKYSKKVQEKNWQASQEETKKCFGSSTPKGRVLAGNTSNGRDEELDSST